MMPSSLTSYPLLRLCLSTVILALSIFYIIFFRGYSYFSFSSMSPLTIGILSL